MVYSDELYHYGRSIKDGAPGVGTGNWRRGGSSGPIQSKFRNSIKGQLTTKGLEAVNKVANSGAVRYVNYESDTNDQYVKLQYNIKSIDDKTDLVKKGTPIDRIAGEEGIGRSRKYVSLGGSFDSENYEFICHWLPVQGNNGDNIYKYSYELTKDIKVAPAKEVRDYVLDNYGETLVRDLRVNSKNFKGMSKRGEKIANKTIRNMENWNVKVSDVMQNIDTYEKIARNHGLFFTQNKTDDKGFDFALGYAAAGHEVLKSVLNKNLAVNDANSKAIMN
jgi:hypothetical protein